MKIVFEIASVKKATLGRNMYLVKSAFLKNTLSHFLGGRSGHNLPRKKVLILNNYDKTQQKLFKFSKITMKHDEIVITVLKLTKY